MFPVKFLLKLVRPSIEYASAVWDPFNKNEISQLDSVQLRVARFVSNNSQDREPRADTVHLKWESLEQRHAKARTVLMYKIIHNLVEIPAEHLLIPSDCRTRGIYTRADVCRFSFFPRPRTIITWNSIPPQVRQASTINQFQAGLRSITLPVQSQM